MTIFTISASAFVEDRERSIELGADAFIAKPVEFEELISAIEMHLDLEPVYEEVEPGAAARPPYRYPVLPPPPDLANDLAESAAAGRIIDLQRHIDRLDTLGEQYESLAAELRRLAGGYQFEAIDKLLASIAGESEYHGD